MGAAPAEPCIEPLLPFFFFLKKNPSTCFISLSFPLSLPLACLQPSVIAYAACCQLDSEDRPLAGTIVYCGQHLRSPTLSHDDIVMVTAAC